MCRLLSRAWFVLLMATLLPAQTSTDKPSAQEIQKLIHQLGNRSYRLRKDAERQLTELGSQVVPALRKTALTSKDLEIRKRATELAEAIPRLELLSVSKSARQATALLQVPVVNSGRAQAQGQVQEYAHIPVVCLHSSGLFLTTSSAVRAFQGTCNLLIYAGFQEQQSVPARVLQSGESRDLALIQTIDKLDYPTVALSTQKGISELVEVIQLVSASTTQPEQLTTFVPVSAYRGFISSMTKYLDKHHSLMPNQEVLLKAQEMLHPVTNLYTGPLLDSQGKLLGIPQNGVSRFSSRSSSSRNVTVDSTNMECIPVSRIREFISTPFIQLSLPTVVADDANKPAQFQAEFIELTPQKKLVELELTINANGLDTTKKMKQIKGKYLIEMPPVPESKEGPKYSVRLMLQDGSITGLCPEHTFSIGKQKLQLKDVLSLQFEPTQTRAMLIDGNALTGPLSGLKHWTIPLGGVDRKIPLTKIKQVIIAPSQLARVVQCTVQAKRDGKVIAETRQTLLIGRPEELP